MTHRRAARPSQVRPRPPSTGRPAPTKVRPRAPSPGRLSTHRGGKSRRRVPWLARFGLALAVIALGAGVFVVATGGLTRVLGSIGSSVNGFIDNLTATPSPKPTIPMVADPPLIERPSEPYTTLAAVDIVAILPPEVVGDPNTVLRLYLGLPDQVAAPILEVAVGTNRRLVIPDVELTDGQNDFTATLIGPAGESEPSPIVTFVLDAAPPNIILSSPADGSTINGAAVDLVGRTQGRTTLVAVNAGNNVTVNGIAAADGTFKLPIPLADGTNAITITATDPAGNVASTVLTLARGSGKLSAKVSASAYQFSAKKLPATIDLAALVNDPDGRPLQGAQVTFILTIPGIQPVTADRETGPDGRATFQTTVPKGATAGQQGGLSILVTTSEFGSTTARSVIRIVK